MLKNADLNFLYEKTCVLFFVVVGMTMGLLLGRSVAVINCRFTHQLGQIVYRVWVTTLFTFIGVGAGYILGEVFRGTHAIPFITFSLISLNHFLNP